MRLRTLGIATAIAMVGALILSGTAQANHGHHGGRPLSVSLRGANEVPVAGDPDGSGTASLWLNPGHDRICFDIHVTGISLPATATYIHQGAAGVSGGAMVTLTPPSTTGSSRGCVVASSGTVMAIVQNPSAYYLNVYTVDFSNGALRGQLTGSSTGPTTTSSRSFSASLKGSSEAPLAGDPDGSGSALIVVTPNQNQICFTIHTSRIWLPATAAYLQQGAAGILGPVVASLAPPNVNGDSSGCVGGLSPGLTSAIIGNSSGYYVNVLTPEFPNGAIRGQLTGSGQNCGGGGDGDGDDDGGGNGGDLRPPSNSGGGGGGGGGDGCGGGQGGGDD